MDERLLRIGFETCEFARCCDARALAERALALLARSLAAPGGSFLLVEPSRLVRLAGAPPENATDELALPAAPGSWLAEVVERGETVVLDEVARGDGGCLSGWVDSTVGPLLAAPCRDSTGSLRAVICVSGRAQPFAAAERELARVVAAHAAEALLTIEQARRLRASEEGMRQLVEHALVGICLFQDERVLYANPRMAEMLGLPGSEAGALSGRGALEFVDEPDRGRLRLDAGRRLAGEPLPGRDEIRLVRVDGGSCWAEVLLRAIEHEGRPALLVHAVDVSARKRAEEEKLQLEAQFLHAQKMEAIGRLAGGVAHDFNNLLMAISGHTELLARRIPEQHKRHLEHIRKATELAAGLTRQLLAFSRKQVLETQVVSLNDLVTATHKLLRRIIGEDVRLDLRLDPSAFPVRADPSLIGQVLMNLAVNARDAMPQGGTLTIETENAELAPDQPGAPPGLTPGAYVRLSVADTGVGMTREVLERLFEPFFTTKERGKGTGLGLAMVYGTVQQTGGRIAVESAPGAGSTFRLYFPRATVAVCDASRTAGVDEAPRGDETVLIVEDESEVRHLLASMLKGLGYSVLLAADAEEALHAFQGHAGPVHVLLTDVVLPGISGPELGRLLRNLQPELRVLYASGYLDESAPGQSLPEGAILLRKPFSFGELATSLRRVLESRG